MKLGILELLLASQTVWGTFESQVLLRHFTIVGVYLFVFWGLSPVGGQSSLRILGTRMASSTTNGASLVYMPTGNMLTNMTYSVFSGADTTTGIAATNALYNANLLTPETTKKVLSAFAKGQKPKPGPQSSRQTSENSAGLTALTSKVSTDAHDYVVILINEF